MGSLNSFPFLQRSELIEKEQIINEPFRIINQNDWHKIR